MLRCALLLGCIASGIAATVVSAPHYHPSLALPSSFVGDWAGAPTYTVFGPLNGPFNFSIRDVAGTYGTMWLMSDVFAGFQGTGSVQQFWVKSTVNATSGRPTSNLTYCGDLTDFFDEIQGGAFVQVNLTETIRTNNTMQWFLHNSHTNGPNEVPWAGRWTLHLGDDGNTLKSEFMLPDATAVHLSVVYSRVNDKSAPIPPPPVPLPANLSDSSTCRVAFDGIGEAPVAATSSTTKSKKKRGKCPFGYDRRPDPSPAAKAAVAALAASYEYCYLINPALNVSVAWNWNTTSQTIDAVVTTTATGDDYDRYVAIGFFPNWPGMQGMDIALGYLTHDDHRGLPTGCVQSLYAQWYVGTPVANPNQTLTNTRVWTRDGLLHVAFSRPWVSGHTNLAQPPGDGIPSFSFAVGRVQRPPAATNGTTDACGGEPQYHGGHRGTYGMLWQQPGAALPAHMKCGAS